MKRHIWFSAIALALSAQTSWAANNIDILQPVQSVQLDIAGDQNTLQILQETAGGPASNSIVLSIHGDLNGGPLGSSFTGAALEPGFNPGSLIQQGYGNGIALNVSGSNNLFAISQLGNDNMVTASIVGSANQASVLQVGNGNVVGFSQSGIGNTVSIMQRSW